MKNWNSKDVFLQKKDKFEDVLEELVHQVLPGSRWVYSYFLS